MDVYRKPETSRLRCGMKPFLETPRQPVQLPKAAGVEGLATPTIQYIHRGLVHTGNTFY